jgi:energy-coupling factor transporter ATP-binding protein EcfA2
MAFINLRTSLVDINGNTISKNLGDWWNYLKEGINPYPNIGGSGYWEFQSLIDKFNEDFEFYLNSITETANQYLEDKFKEKFHINFEYKKCVYNPKIDNVRTRKTHAPEIYLTATLIDSNLDVNTHKVNRVHTFLNEAKLSSIALAIRMAILKDKFVEESPKILILDDLLLSLDMGNREAVLNIVLEEYCADYQIIFLTHDRVFFQTVISYIKTFNAKKKRDNGVTDKKILDDAYKENWKILEMYESNLPDGKYIPVIMEYQSNIQKAHHYFSHPEHIDYNACGNNLRAALEDFFRRFIPQEFLRDGNNNPIDRKSLTLNPLIERCINYFNNVGFETSILEKLNRYRERALNQTSHYNPNSNYFKRELQDTFEILNVLEKYKTEAIVEKDEILNFSVASQSGKQFSFNFKPLDDIRLYLEPTNDAISFYCPNDKRAYGFVEFIDESGTNSFDVVVRNKTLNEFYNETIGKLEEKIGESCTREDDVFDVIKNSEGKSLNDLKKY